MVGLAALSELQRHFRGELVRDPRALASYSHDFGGMVKRAPALVLRPISDQDVLLVLQTAAQYGFSVTTRGSGHSQAGQSLGDGVVLDMTRLNRVKLSAHGDHPFVEVEAGATWRNVVDATFRRSELPLALTHALETTVAGTLSIGGVGAESFREGAQVDNVAYLDIATCHGEIVRASHEEQRELFDAVRAGLGQCGVILRAGYPLRRCRPGIRTQSFAYGNPEQFLRDGARLVDASSTGWFLTGTIVKHPFRGGPPLLIWLVGQEHGPGDELEPLPTLECDAVLPSKDSPLWEAGGKSEHPFFRVFGTHVNQSEVRALNPWVEHLFDLHNAPAALENLMKHVAALGQGKGGVVLVKRKPKHAPLFATPTKDHLIVGLGMFPSFAPGQQSAADELMTAYLAYTKPFRGKRYLSGYVRHTASEWADHFDEQFAGFDRAKRRFDPLHCLNPGFISWG